MGREIVLNEWIKVVKARTKKVSGMRRPKRPFRSINSRLPEESDALANITIQNWNKAFESGALERGSDGSYRVCSRDADLFKDSHKPPFIKQLELASKIYQKLKECGTMAVVDGGVAVQFYTWATYAMKDIDFIVTETAHIKECMETLGFENCGDMWKFPDMDIIVEFSVGSLADIFEKLTFVKTGVGSLAIIGIEDIIIAKSVNKQCMGDVDEWVKFLIRAHYDILDWNYLKQRATETGCLETIVQLQNLFGYNSR